MSAQDNIETINQILDNHSLIQTGPSTWGCTECDWITQGWWGEATPRFGDHLMTQIMAALLPVQTPRTG